MSISNIFVKAREAIAAKGAITLTLDEILLNNVISRLLKESDGSIRSLKLQFGEGACTASADVSRIGIAAHLSLDFTLTKFQIDATRQVITIHRMGELNIEGDSVWSKVAILVVKAIVTSLLRQDLLDRALSDMSAVTISGPDISADLGELGIAEKIIEAVVERWLSGNPLVKTLLHGAAKTGGGNLLQRVSITDARCTSGGLEVVVALVTK